MYSCAGMGEPRSTGGCWKSKSPLTLTARKLDGMSKNHLLPLLFPKLPSFIHSSGRKLLACAYAHFYGLLLLGFFVTTVKGLNSSRKIFKSCLSLIL